MHHPTDTIAHTTAFHEALDSLLQLYWAVVLLQHKCEKTYSHPNPNQHIFVMDERADPGQN